MELMNYVEAPDVPEGMTLSEWRATRFAVRAPEGLGSVRRLRARFPGIRQKQGTGPAGIRGN